MSEPTPPDAPAGASAPPAPPGATDPPDTFSVAETDRPFSRRALCWVVGLAVGSFVIALVFAIFGDELGRGVPSAGPDSYSRSAIGHRGFVRLLEAYDITVVRSRHVSGARAGDRAVLLLAEPSIAGDEQRAQLTAALASASRTVLVLPKRTGDEDPEKRAWLERSDLLMPGEVTLVLAAAGLGGEVHRTDASIVNWSAGDSRLPTAPALHTAQLISGSEQLEPLLANEHGILVGYYDDDEGHEIVVIADPDLLANHGLADGDNAAIALAALEHIRPEGAVVVVDETLHGHVSSPSLWRELFSFPLSLATASVLIAIAVLLWAAMGRFGKPRPAQAAIAAGKGFLIDNTAELIRYGGHAAHALERYLHATVQDVARASHAPQTLGPQELREWLLRAARARKVPTDLVALEREVADVAREPKKQAARALATAGRIHRWRQEMTDGSAGHSRAS